MDKQLEVWNDLPFETKLDIWDQFYRQILERNWAGFGPTLKVFQYQSHGEWLWS